MNYYVFDGMKYDYSDIRVRCNIRPSQCIIPFKECKMVCGIRCYVPWTFYLINKKRLVISED